LRAQLSDLVTRPLHGHLARRLVPDLKAWLAARLPEYMWPDHYIRLKQLPVSANGKIDKAVLPLPDRFRPELREAFVEARTETERRLAALWSSVLDVATPGVSDHFFNELGGHSLLATQLISRVRPRIPGGAAAARDLRKPHHRGDGTGHRCRATGFRAGSIAAGSWPRIRSQRWISNSSTKRRSMKPWRGCRKETHERH
jgi:hypothetical protein